jgi:hypothetical protein
VEPEELREARERDGLSIEECWGVALTVSRVLEYRSPIVEYKECLNRWRSVWHCIKEGPSR